MADLARLECILHESGYGRSFGEDRTLLPTLMGLTRRTFVEIGAWDGFTQSTTYALERCMNWTGVLIEANPDNYAQLVRSRRQRSAMVHSAVCHGDGSSGNAVLITRDGSNFAGEPTTMANSYIKRWWSAPSDRLNETVTVPCRSLRHIMHENGLPHGADFLSLDVEGAEEKVLHTVNVALFRVIMVEMDGHDRKKDARIDVLLTSSGFRRASALRVPLSTVYLRHDVEELPSGDVDLTGAFPRLAPRAGYCAVTEDGPSDCALDSQGSWSHKRRATVRNELTHCWSRCLQCKRCRYLSVSTRARECSWFANCDLDQLNNSASTDHYTFAVPK